MNPLTFIMTVFSDVTSHAWMALAIAIVGFVATALSSASNFPVSIPDRWRSVLVIVLGQGYAVLVAIKGGVAWLPAVEQGLVVAFTTMGLAKLLLEAVFPNGLPTWLQWLPMLAGVPKEKRGMSLRPPPPPTAH